MDDRSERSNSNRPGLQDYQSISGAPTLLRYPLFYAFITLPCKDYLLGFSILPKTIKPKYDFADLINSDGKMKFGLSCSRLIQILLQSGEARLLGPIQLVLVVLVVLGQKFLGAIQLVLAVVELLP